MTGSPSPTARSGLQPGTRGFTIVLSMAMAVTALAIDTVLPAFPEIREHLGLDDDSTAVAGLITAFLVGSGLGQLPAGLLADRFGRRPVLWGGLALYGLGGIGAALAPSLELMLVARFVWGLGSAGPRVAAVAMVRDAYEGERMARQMSNMMAVFLVVPTIAPSLGAALVAIGPWQLVFWVCVVASGAVFAMSLQLPATLPADERRPLAVGDVWRSMRAVVAAPGTIAYLVALTVLFGSFISYLASSEIIVDEVFGLAPWFPVIFGGLSVVMAVTMVSNGRVVERVGLERLLTRLLSGQIVAALALLGLALLTDGRPPFGAFIVVFVFVLGCNIALTPNLNSAAMRPLGEVAGTAAAVLGMVPLVVGSVLGGVIDRSFDGTITPLAVAFTVASCVAMLATRSAMRSSAGSGRAAVVATVG